MSTTPIVSELFACGECHAPVAIVLTPGAELVYQCLNERCQKAVSVDCPEALALAEEVSIALTAAVDAAFAPVYAVLDASWSTGRAR